MRPHVLRRGLILSAVVVLTFANVVAAGERVTHWGDPVNWRLEGVESFEPARVKRALTVDLDVQLATHPLAPLDDLPSTLRDRLLEGYHSQGFASATAKVNFDRQQKQIVVNVEEGTRQYCGQVCVDGVNPELAEILRAALTTKQFKDEVVVPVLGDNGRPLHWLDVDGNEAATQKPLWVAGDAVAFHKAHRLTIDRQVSRTLGEHGYYSPRFSHALIPTGANAALHLTVHKLGSQAVLREIEVIGNQKNTYEEIVNYLKLQVGQHFTSVDRHRLLAELRNSARFIQQRVDATPIAQTGGIKLKIEVQELSVAPRLSEPLSREDEALLKLREWETQGAGQLLDRAFEVESARFRAVMFLSPTGGMAGRVETKPTPQHPEPISVLLLCTGNQFFLVNTYEQTCYHSPLPAKYGINFTLQAVVKGKGSERRFAQNLGIGIAALDEIEPPGNPIRWRTSADPAYYIAMGRLESPACTWDGNVLTVRHSYRVLVIDAATGKLLRQEVPPGADGAISMWREAGLFTQLKDPLEESLSSQRNEFDHSRPATSTVRSLASLLPFFASFVPDNEQLRRMADPNAMAAVNKLLDGGLLEPWDRQLTKPGASDEPSKFSIPSTIPIDWDLKSAGPIILLLTDRVFARDTWPANLSRAIGMYMTGHGEYTNQEVTSLLQDESFGPLGHWILADLLKAVSPAAAQVVATRGLQRLDRQAFEQDVALILAHASENFERNVQLVCSLSNNELAALGQFGPGDSGSIVQLARSIRERSNDSNRDTLISALGDRWADQWRDAVANRLRQISRSDPPPVDNEPAEQ